MQEPGGDDESPPDEVKSVRVELESLPDFSDDGLPDFSASSSSKSTELPALDPEHELHVEVQVPESRDEPSLEELPVLGPEHEVYEEDELPDVPGAGEELPEELPVLGTEHELHDEELPVLGAEHEVAEEEPPLLGAEHEVHDEPEPAPIAAESSDGEAEEAPEPEDSDDSRNYRQIYETELRPMERDARIALAHTAEGSMLCALCLDPEPAVIRAVLESSLAGLDHARLVARHHRNPVGLELVVQRTEFARDSQVQRLLVRNSQLTESLLRRLIGQKPLRELYKVCVDRDVSEKNRVGSRGLLRARWGSSSSEERADFVIATEARCLTLLIGQTFDSRMTSILCGKQFASVLFIQNLARFPACPPALLVHLLKQPFVRKSQPLKKLLLQHPNLPSQAKRNL